MKRRIKFLALAGILAGLGLGALTTPAPAHAQLKGGGPAGLALLAGKPRVARPSLLPGGPSDPHWCSGPHGGPPRPCRLTPDGQIWDGQIWDGASPGGQIWDDAPTR